MDGGQSRRSKKGESTGYFECIEIVLPGHNDRLKDIRSEPQFAV
jgi:hypothetical protein